MGAVRRAVNTVIVKVPYSEFPHEQGTIELGHGMQEIFIPTSQTPARVWLCFQDFQGVQTCLGQLDCFSWYITRDGFVIVAEVKSESAFVKWIADFI
jgi:hypothetical protein